MPLVEEIIASRLVDGTVEPGQLVVVEVDHAYLQDGNTPTIRRLFRENGFERVFDPARVTVFFDHGVLSPTAAMTDRLREAEDFAEELGVGYFPAGRGISHVIALETGIYQPGRIVVASDSHTCTGGVVQCLALGMGASDVTAAMVTGRVWLRVPETVWLRTRGWPSAAAGPKDVMLYALAERGQGPFLYRALEWCGDWVSALTLDGAATVANMAVEQGCKCCFLPEGEGRPAGMRSIDPGPGGDVLTLDIDGLEPFVARPPNPMLGTPLSECPTTAVKYVMIGSCTNGRTSDLIEVARVLRGRRVARSVHCLVTPGSLDVYRRAIGDGTIETLLDAGAIVTPPGCGSCVGTQGTIPGSDDTVVATTSRNFIGRMGNPKAEIWLASPLVAAWSAVLGRLPRVDEIELPEI